MSRWWVVGLAIVVPPIAGCGTSEASGLTAEQIEQWCEAVDVWDNGGRHDIADYDQVIALAPMDVKNDLRQMRLLVGAFVAHDPDEPGTQERVETSVDEPGFEELYERADAAFRQHCRS
jgi:hypothetical protein